MNSNTMRQETTEKAAKALLKSIARVLNLHLHYCSAYVAYGQPHASELALETSQQTRFTAQYVVIPY